MKTRLMQQNEIQQNRFIRNFAKDRWLIFASGAVVMLFALTYLAFLYKPGYQSEAKVWIKDTATASYLSANREEPGYLSSLTQAGNPVMTQSEILMSKEMENYLADVAIRENARLNQAKSLTEKPDTEKIIKVKTEPNTDILKVQLKWNDPAMAKTLLTAALAKLDQTNLDINRKIYTQKRQYIETQLRDIEGKLAAVRDKMQDYQAGNNAVDVDTQTQELIRLRSQLLTQLETAKAARNNNASSAAALQNQLSMNAREAIQAVALGTGNENLTKMRTDLATLKQQYAHDSIKEAPTNPHLVALKSQIDTLEAQLRNEQMNTVGNVRPNSPMIFDSVRSQLVQDLASSNTKTAALGAEASSLAAAIGRVDSTLKTLPKRRLTMSGLQEQERALSLAYDELRKRDIEATMKEAEAASNVFVVDAPTLPEKPSFPTPLHVLALSVMLGGLTGLGASLLKTRWEDLCEGADAIKAATDAKILGVVPWLPQLPEFAPTDTSLFGMNDVACKQIISSLRIEASRHEAQVLVFTSTSLDKPRTGGVYHLAQCMERVGQTVAYIEADFRPSDLLKYIPDPNAGTDLTDLILAADLNLRKGVPLFADDLLAGMMRDENGLHIALNRQTVANPYDYFASRGFQYVVNLLREHFDWVFINTPSAVIAPEFTPIANASEGVVLLVDKQATFRAIRKVTEKVHEAQVPLLGSIVREQNGDLVWEHETYNHWNDPWSGGGGLPAVAASVGAPSGKKNGKRVEFMGAKIDALTMTETVDHIFERMARGERIRHVVVNVAKLMMMKNNPVLRREVNSSDLINADGTGIVMGARLLGIHIPERVTGIDLMENLVRQAAQQGHRVYFLGAEADVAQDVVSHYKQKYPKLHIAGYHHGYFTNEQEADVVEKIRVARPDILFVAISSPKKEHFTGRYAEVLNIPFVMGVGGSFDVVAGKVRRAPLWMQRAGLEWFYRLAQEPGRMWRRYLFTNLHFGLELATRTVSYRLRSSNA